MGLPYVYLQAYAILAAPSTSKQLA